MVQEPTRSLKACPCCGLVHEVPALDRTTRAACVRCRSTVADGRRPLGAELSLAAALAALVLYPLAVSLPVLRLERFGHRTEASIWTGSLGLFEKGELLVGAVVLTCSLVVPLVKLLALVAIGVRWSRLARSQRARTHRVLEWAGRWGMLDVLLIAVVVAWIKMGDLVEVTPGPGALAFVVCVLLSLVAGAAFDPHDLWEGEAA